MKRLYLLSVLFVLFSLSTTFAVEFTEEAKLNNNTMFFPAELDFNDFQWSFGMMATTLPKDWVETAVNAPLFTFNFRYGVPYNFSLISAFEFVFVSNQIRLGPHWGLEFEHFAFNVGLDMGYVLGALNQFGFKNKYRAFYLYPNITFGYKVNDLFFTLQAELMVNTARQLTTDGIETGSSINKMHGGTISLFLEQPLWKDRIFIVGLKSNITKFYYLAWPAFTTFNKIYYIPQLYLGLVL